METTNGGERRAFPLAPREKFTLYGTEVDIANYYSPDVKTRKAAIALKGATGDLKLSDQSMHHLMRTLERTDLTIDEYRKSMPRLLEYAVNRDTGGYSVPMSGIIFQTLDMYGRKMPLSLRSVPGGWVSAVGREERPVFFATVYGHIEP